MIEEALKYLTTLGEQKGARFVPGSPNPKHIAILEKRDGTIETIIAHPEPRDHVASDLSAIIEFAERDPDGAAVWYSREQVVCLLNDADRRDRVTLTLQFSPPLAQLIAFERNPNPLKQAALVLLLRTTFAACLAPAGEILAAVRNLKFKVGGGGESNLQHGSVSVGRAIQQEMTGVKTIPETIALEVPIFTNAHLPYTGRIQVAIDIDPATEAFRLIPLPLEIERAIAAAEAKICEELVADLGVDGIYYGHP